MLFRSMLAVQSSFFVQKLDILGNSVVIRAGKSIAHMAFLVAQEILDQPHYRGVGASDLGNQRTTMRKFQGYGCAQFTAFVFGKSWASEATVKIQFTSLSKF